MDKNLGCNALSSGFYNSLCKISICFHLFSIIFHIIYHNFQYIIWTWKFFEEVFDSAIHFLFLWPIMKSGIFEDICPFNPKCWTCWHTFVHSVLLLIFNASRKYDYLFSIPKNGSLCSVFFPFIISARVSSNIKAHISTLIFSVVSLLISSIDTHFYLLFYTCLLFTFLLLIC